MAGGDSFEAIEKRLDGRVTFALAGFIEEFEDPAGNYIEPLGQVTRHGLLRTRVRYGEHPVSQQAKAERPAILRRILGKMGCGSIRSGVLSANASHAVATCRMSANEADGVVDANLRVHGTDNLFVCSNAVFPNPAAVNPTLTLTALGIRLGEHLSEA